MLLQSIAYFLFVEHGEVAYYSCRIPYHDSIYSGGIAYKTNSLTLHFA